MQTTRFIRLRQLAAAIGVSESSLKRWADRGLIPSVKTVGGHRRLPAWAVADFLRRTGHSVVRGDLLGLGAALPDSPLNRAAPTSVSLADLLLHGSPEETQGQVIQLYLGGSNPVDLCDELFRPAMTDIGARWADGAIDVHHEHRATQVLSRVLAQLRGLQRPPSAAAPLAIGASPAGDPYTLAGQMADWVLRSAGWRSDYLGPDMPLASLARAVGELRPRVVWLSVSAPRANGRFWAGFAELRAATSQVGAAVVLGGRAADEELRSRLTYASHGDRMRHLLGFVEGLNVTVGDEPPSLWSAGNGRRPRLH